MARVLLLLTVLLAAGCATPVVRRPLPLTDTSALQPEYREGANAVANYLGQKGENPREFFVTVAVTPNSNEVVYHVTHQQTFSPENRNVVGNPSGKDGVVYYDLRARKVTKMLYLQ